jgi:hypothetical protein
MIPAPAVCAAGSTFYSGLRRNTLRMICTPAIPCPGDRGQRLAQVSTPNP